MGFVERHEIMTFTLLPNIARRFQQFEGTEYPRISCATCHGTDAEDVHYRMPASLPPLDPDRMPDPRSRISRFMSDVVVPMTDRMMQAGGTVTCFSCHPRGTP